MPDYDDPKTMAQHLMWVRYENNTKGGHPPNRRGNYPGSEKWNYYKWKGSRKNHPVIRKWSPTKQKEAQGRETGARKRRNRKRALEARVRGFQHEFVPMEKPKVPGRILRDAQEEALWANEDHWTAEDQLAHEYSLWLDD